MAESSLPTEQDRKDDVLELNRDLERMIESAENMSVQLTWMAYDMVALRTSPELAASMRKLEEAYHRCRAAVYGDCDQEPETDTRPEPAATTPAQM
ncbi:synaptonemal complex central element protein 3 [Toxotes jaculatrix]|uniref:synaptonemal complex central element protein 3 n=1 Tax=Toxotes jaculatrix TaxID=941984 RepID=UPI001B3AFC3F|nr:synaptonemal complex central element protein 3 [Toxotes jaculatrix]